MENRHGLTTQVAYTYSHEIDEVSNDLNSLSNPFNPAYDRGSGGFDRRHILNVNYIYNLPFFEHSSKRCWRARSWAAGSSLASRLRRREHPRMHQDIPASATADVLGLGGNTTNRPDLVAPISYPKKRLAWFSTSVFCRTRLLPGTAVPIRALATPAKMRSWDRGSSISIGPCSRPFHYFTGRAQPGTAI